MCTEVTVKINDIRDYNTKAKGLEFPKLTCNIGKMKGENENTVRQ